MSTHYNSANRLCLAEVRYSSRQRAGVTVMLVRLFAAERARPYLITHDSNDSTDYINAVYVDVSTT